jgi:methylase of polypeptide subunit release factors
MPNVLKSSYAVGLQDLATELNVILRGANVEPALRAMAVGAVLFAMSQGEIDEVPGRALESINRLVGSGLRGLRLQQRALRTLLREAKVYSGENANKDVLGALYNTFLRHRCDNHDLGIVFTPAHITDLCADLLGVSDQSRVIDIACGTGAFLVAAVARMERCYKSSRPRTPRHPVWGFEPNPTVWALASLNFLIRGSTKDQIRLTSCFQVNSRTTVRGKFSHAFLNPPFFGGAEPEVVDFIGAALDTLEAGGVLAAVVPAGIFADGRHKAWRTEFLRDHTLVGIISLPEWLFYPVAAPTSIMLAKAHIPHPPRSGVFLGRVWNDGFVKRKNTRAAGTGSQIPEIRHSFDCFARRGKPTSRLATVVSGQQLTGDVEWSPQAWLPQPKATSSAFDEAQRLVVRSIFLAVGQIPALADKVLKGLHQTRHDRRGQRVGALTDFFDVQNGRSDADTRYQEGTIPYVSSGDASNGVTRLLGGSSMETFKQGGITVSAFGAANVQPWSFMARGNGGSAVRVLIPRNPMGFSDLVWFPAQINLQQWRFSYARMAIKARLSALTVEAPVHRLRGWPNIRQQILRFRANLEAYSSGTSQ